jgi:hypothetical protein
MGPRGGAAIHGEDCAGDEARVVRKQEGDGGGHLGRLAFAADRVGRADTLHILRILKHAGGQGRPDHPGRHAVHADATRRKFQRDTAGEADDGMLRSQSRVSSASAPATG